METVAIADGTISRKSRIALPLVALFCNKTRPPMPMAERPMTVPATVNIKDQTAIRLALTNVTVRCPSAALIANR